MANLFVKRIQNFQRPVTLATGGQQLGVCFHTNGKAGARIPQRVKNRQRGIIITGRHLDQPHHVERCAVQPWIARQAIFEIPDGSIRPLCINYAPSRQSARNHAVERPETRLLQHLLRVIFPTDPKSFHSQGQSNESGLAAEGVCPLRHPHAFAIIARQKRRKQGAISNTRFLRCRINRQSVMLGRLLGIIGHRRKARDQKIAVRLGLSRTTIVDERRIQMAQSTT